MDNDDRERNTDGRYAARVPDSALIEFIESANRGFRVTSEVADHFGYAQSTAYRRLCALAEADAISREQLPTTQTLWCPDNREPATATECTPECTREH